MKYLLLLLIAFNTFAADESSYEDYESISFIPEPMVFDLVRPLGSKKGQWEVNALVLQEHASELSDMHESPEIEYVAFDDVAIELELPAVGGEFEAFKGVLQWTIGHSGSCNQMVHGMQLIEQRYVLGNPYSETTPLYIFGYRLNHDYSALLMLGDQYRHGSGKNEHRVVLNATLFQVHSMIREIEFGLEQNVLGYGNNFEYWRVMPQMEVVLENHSKIQVGFGALYTYDHRWDSSSGLRLVKEFY